jgi:hypothetical protein
MVWEIKFACICSYANSKYEVEFLRRNGAMAHLGHKVPPPVATPSILVLEDVFDCDTAFKT